MMGIMPLAKQTLIVLTVLLEVNAKIHLQLQSCVKLDIIRIRDKLVACNVLLDIMPIVVGLQIAQHAQLGINVPIPLHHQRHVWTDSTPIHYKLNVSHALLVITQIAQMDVYHAQQGFTAMTQAVYRNHATLDILVTNLRFNVHSAQQDSMLMYRHQLSAHSVQVARSAEQHNQVPLNVAQENIQKQAVWSVPLVQKAILHLQQDQ